MAVRDPASRHDAVTSFPGSGRPEFKKARSALTYVTLVGLPILGVFGVLKLGKELRSPISVAGAWRLELSREWSNGVDCGPVRLSDALTINVSQAGSALSLSVEAGEVGGLTGELAGSRISAAGKASAILIKAEIDTAAEPDRMSGFITLSGGREAERIGFVAIRGSLSARSDRSH
jgi:hypothetical protein